MNYLIFSVLLCSIAVCYGACPAGQVKESGVASFDIVEAVNRHNYQRMQIAQGLVPGQPKGSNLKRMYWDATLAASAQDISNTCNFTHVTVKDSRWPAVGQNLYMSWSSAWQPGADWNAAVDSWFAEHQYFTYPSTSAPGKVTGHYTQVVWALSNFLGCGYTAWFDSSSSFYKKLYTCNYGPAGNYVGQAPYTTGAGCENLC